MAIRVHAMQYEDISNIYKKRRYKKKIRFSSVYNIICDGLSHTTDRERQKSTAAVLINITQPTQQHTLTGIIYILYYRYYITHETHLNRYKNKIL